MLPHKQVNQIPFPSILLLIFILGISIYFQSLQYPFSNFDDGEYVVYNGDIRRINFDNLAKWFSRDYGLIYLPATMASYASDYQVWHLDPLGYRLTNVILHCLSGYLVFLILAGLTNNCLLAFGVSFLFIIHPVQIESVVWISERKNVLSAFFLLLAFYQYVNQRAILTLCFFLAALLSKPSVFVAPLVFVLYDYFYQRKKRIWFYVAATGIAFGLAAITIGTHVSAGIVFRGGSFLRSCYILSIVFFRYWQLLLFPYVQQFFYSTKVYSSFLSPLVFISCLGILSMTLFLWLNRKKHPDICFWMCWYLVFLLPPLNFILPLPSLMNDRYLYLPLIGFFGAVFLAFHKMTKGVLFGNQTFFNRLLSWVALALLAVPFFLLSYNRIRDWRTQGSLWEADIQKAKYQDPRVHTGLASSHIFAGRTLRAVGEIDKTLQVKQDDRILLWQVQNYLTLNNLDKAREYLALSEKIVQKERFGDFFDLDGQLYEKEGQYADALAAYQRAIRARQKVPYYIHMETLYRKMGKTAEAYRVLQEAERVDPDSDDVLAELCMYHLKINEFDKAEKFYKRLKLIYPNDPLVKQLEDRSKKWSPAGIAHSTLNLSAESAEAKGNPPSLRP